MSLISGLYPAGRAAGLIPCRRCATSKLVRMRFLLGHWPILAAVFLMSSVSAAQSRIDCSALNSRILKQVVHYCVFLPSGYDQGAAKPAQRYPVLYFLHGLGDNERTLFNSGRLDVARRSAQAA